MHMTKNTYKRYRPRRTQGPYKNSNKWIFISVLCALICLVLIFGSITKELGGTKNVKSITLESAGQSGEGKKAASVKKSTADISINVYDTKLKRIKAMKLEDYVMCVLPAEVPVSYEMEALRAQAVAARTYAFKKMISNGGDGCNNNPKADVCTSSTSCQAYISLERRKKDWGDKFDEYENRIKEAALATRGQIIIYQDKPIQAFFHSTSGGMTEDSENVFSEQLPYCRAVESPGEENGLKYEEETSFSLRDFAKTLSAKYPESKLSADKLKTDFKILSRYKSGRVESLEAGRAKLTGVQIRTLFNLNSANFDILISGDNITLKTHGFGHGVGMSQEGANAMAKKGADYVEILTHYYQGVDIGVVDDYGSSAAHED